MAAFWVPVTQLSELDIPQRLAPGIPIWMTQIGVGLAAAVSAWLVRLGIDQVAPGAAPFSLVFPAIILATLFARWFAGFVCGATAILYVWVTAKTLTGSLAVVSVSIAAVITLAIAELFRASAHRAQRERDREIADRDLFLSEVDHRMKNNFAIVAGLLDVQRRRASDPATAEALRTAQARVESIAGAHRHLYRGSGQPGSVEMREYLSQLCNALADSLFLRGGVTLECDADEALIPRDRAVSIGLVVNEAVTNAAKHAFAGRDFGRITVGFRTHPAGATLVVGDDGVGLAEEPAEPTGDGGLGSRLIQAFARQCGGTVRTDSDAAGTRVTLELPA